MTIQINNELIKTINTIPIERQKEILFSTLDLAKNKLGSYEPNEDKNYKLFNPNNKGIK